MANELHEQRCQTEIKNNFEKKTVVNLEDDQKMRFSWALIKKTRLNIPFSPPPIMTQNDSERWKKESHANNNNNN